MIGIYITGLLILFFGFLNLFGISQNLFFSQFTFFLVGLFLMFVIKKIGRNFFSINNKFFYWLFIGFLLLVLFFGAEIRGAKRWLDLYFINFQPSEFFKVFYLIFLSNFMAKRKRFADKRLEFLFILIYFLIPAFLIFKQPDLGNTIILTMIFLSLTFFSDIPKKYFVQLIVVVLLTMPLGWFLLQPYQKTRLLSFLSPHLDRQGTAYNMIQSIITIGSGKFFGKGLGLGTQTRLYFLPENSTDFAFASLVEQFGFFGGASVIILFFLFSYFLLRKLFKYFNKVDEQGRQNFFFLLGLSCYLISQIVINIGMNMGLFPITGITLPLISYGGSSLVSFMIGLAFLP